MKVTLGELTVETMKGNIVKQDDLDAIVNAANAQLQIGGGVAGAIHRAAGRGLAEECRPMAPIKPGEAVISGGHNLPNPHVIHVLGPVYGRDKPEDKLLADCYRNALDLAEEHNITSVGFPAISTGAFGYPMREAAAVAFQTVKKKADELKNVNLVRFVLFDDESVRIHEDELKKLES